MARYDPALRAAALAAALAATCGCALPVYRQSRAPIVSGQPDYQTTVQVRFLGAGGFLIRRGDDVVITSPLYSHPRLPRVLANRPLTIDEAKVAACHRFDDRADAILVGHAHYDHLMDVPPVWLRAGRPTVIGSSTTANILAGYAASPRYQDLPRHVVALSEPTPLGPGLVDSRQCFRANDDPSNWRPASCPLLADHAGGWFDGFGRGAVRVRALCGRHPAQFLGVVHLWQGCTPSPRTTPPLDGRDYREGPTLAYLIDFLDRPGGSVVFRIYYQDAPSDGAIGQVPPEVIQQDRAVDLALLCARNTDVVAAPESIIRNTGARHVLVGHWEKFFQILAEPERLEAIPALDLNPFLKALGRELRPTGVERTLLLPAPGLQVHYRIGPPAVLLETSPAESLTWCRY